MVKTSCIIAGSIILALGLGELIYGFIYFKKNKQKNAKYPLLSHLTFLFEILLTSGALFASDILAAWIPCCALAGFLYILRISFVMLYPEFGLDTS